MSKRLLAIRHPLPVRIFLLLGGAFQVAVFASPAFFEPDRSTVERVFFGGSGVVTLVFMSRLMRERIIFYDEIMEVHSLFRSRMFARRDVAGFSDGGPGHTALRKMVVTYDDGSSDSVGVLRHLSNGQNFQDFLNTCETWRTEPENIAKR